MKRDASEPAIRAALEKAGFLVWDYLPVDLLCYRPDKGVQLLELKSPDSKGRRRKRKDQAKQDAFLIMTDTAVALTPLEALQKLGVA